MSAIPMETRSPLFVAVLLRGRHFEEEAHILLIEPKGTPNTGDAHTAAARRVI
jgi:hypothetical protein